MSRLKNPDSMQIHTTYVTDEGAVCLEVAGQNGMGGMTVSRVVYLTQAWPHRGRRKWEYSITVGDIEVDGWRGLCYKAKAFGRQGDLYPGVDVTEKVKETLKTK
jgi:hypothetical protein